MSASPTRVDLSEHEIELVAMALVALWVRQPERRDEVLAIAAAHPEFGLIVTDDVAGFDHPVDYVDVEQP